VGYLDETNVGNCSTPLNVEAIINQQLFHLSQIKAISKGPLPEIFESCDK
jgi:hypothetical protein